jgi:hypothetical protein
MLQECVRTACIRTRCRIQLLPDLASPPPRIVLCHMAYTVLSRLNRCGGELPFGLDRKVRHGGGVHAPQEKRQKGGGSDEA